MKKSMRILIAGLAVLVVLVMGVLGYYVATFQQLNRMLVSANTTDERSDGPAAAYADVGISYADFTALRVTEGTLGDNEYVQLKTHKKIEGLSLRTVSVRVKMAVTVVNADTGDTLRRYDGSRAIKLAFRSFRWHILGVQD